MSTTEPASKTNKEIYRITEEYYRNLFTAKESLDYLNHEQIKNDLFTENDIITAVKQSNFGKAMGEDWFFGGLLTDIELGQHLRVQLVKMLNEDNIPDYLKEARLVLLSKNGKTTASLDDIRRIAVLPQIMKVLEKAIKNKIEALDSNLLSVGKY